MKKIAVAVVALPILWMTYEVYGLSVRYGTSNPCDMIAERLTTETFESIDPLGLDPFLKRDRPYQLAREQDHVREHGAWACWMSVLFGKPTQTEITHAVVMEAHGIEKLWKDWKEEGDENARSFAIFRTEDASIDVLDQLLVGGKHEIIQATVEAELRHVPRGFRQKAVDAVKEHCRFGSIAIKEDRDTCIARYSALLELSTK